VQVIPVGAASAANFFEKGDAHKSFSVNRPNKIEVQPPKKLAFDLRVLRPIFIGVLLLQE